MEIIYIEDYPKDYDPLNAPPLEDFYHIRIPVSRTDPRPIKTIYEDWLSTHLDVRPVQNPTMLVGWLVTDPVATVKKRRAEMRTKQRKDSH